MAEAILREYRKFDTCAVADALHEHGIDGVVDGPSAVSPTHTAVGLATPMGFERVTESDELTNFPYAMLDELAPGRMFVIDAPSDTISCWGGRASMLAANAGVNGVVINGGCRDIAEISESDLPVFSTGHTPRTGQRRLRVSSVDEPITVSGVEVSSGDIVVADATGVVVVPRDVAGEVLQTADEIFSREALLEAKIENGASVDDLQKKQYEF